VTSKSQKRITINGRESLNNDVQQFHQYQLNQQLQITEHNKDQDIKEQQTPQIN
jgi:ribosomal protein S9